MIAADGQEATLTILVSAKDQGPTIGICRTRIDRSVTVTSAPLWSAFSILGQMPCSNESSAAPSSPSFRIRITDGSRSPLVASRE